MSRNHQFESTPAHLQFSSQNRFLDFDQFSYSNERGKQSSLKAKPLDSSNNAAVTDEPYDAGGSVFKVETREHIAPQKGIQTLKMDTAPHPVVYTQERNTGVGLLVVKEMPELRSPELQESSATKFCMVTSLFISYLIESIVQVLVIFQCYHFFKQPLNWVIVDETGQAAVLSTSFWWFWVLVTGSILSSFLVTLVSVMWVYRGMDFSGRLCGRLLCYVMHSLLLGLLWRYLKLAFAYEKADLEEFLKLKTIHIYIQSLPLVTIHLAWILTTQEHLYFITHQVDNLHTLSYWFIVIEVLSFLVSVLILSASTLSPIQSVHGLHNNLRGVLIVSESSSTASQEQRKNLHESSPHGNSDKMNSVATIKSGDKDSNRHFNDSGTASGVDNHGVVVEKERSNDIVYKKSCSSTLVSPVVTSMRTVAVQMMSHYAQKCESGRALLLVTRVISLAMLVWKMNYYWTGFITLLHFSVSFAWLQCWAKVSNHKSDNNLKFASSPSSQSAGRLTTECNDISCDSRSDGSSNDSGLVVKSEVITENGMHAVANGPLDYYVAEVSAGVDVNNDNNRNKNDFSINIRAHDSQSPATKQPGDFSSCLSVLVHRRNKLETKKLKRATIDDDRNQSSFESTQLLSLAYVLFWDMSSSRSAQYLSQHGIYTLSPWATILPVFLVIIENMYILIYHHLNPFNQPSLYYLPLFSIACMLLGWLLIASYQFKRRVKDQIQQHITGSPDAELIDKIQLDDDADSGYGKNGENSCIGRRSSCSSSTSGHARGHHTRNQDTNECLSMCCSSLSHPLNVKRKICDDSPQVQTTQYFCTTSNDNQTVVANQQRNVTESFTTLNFNEYRQQRELGELMAAECVNNNSNYNKSGTNDDTNSRNNNKKLTKKPTKLPSFTNFVTYQENNGVHDTCKTRPESVPRYKDDVHVTMTCAPTSCNADQSHSTNYTFVKEALTKRISNKSSNEDSLTKKPPHQIYNTGNESVKGDVGVGTYEEGEPQIAISSFKPPSPSSSLHHQQHHPTTNNSNKCMPISIKSPISWLPETCRSELNGSSNRRNTNTLPVSELGASEKGAFYCPEKYLDLDNNNIKNMGESEVSNRHTNKQQINTDLAKIHYRQHCQNLEHETTPGFSGFFEDEVGRSRSCIKKQSRTLLGSSALRASRSANATPVAGSKHPFFEPEIGERRVLEQKRSHPSFQPSVQNIYCKHGSYCNNDDEVDPIERVTKERTTSRRIRNQITGKTYLSDGASLTSLDGLCEIRASTPVEIKKASRVIVNYPPPHHQVFDSKTVSRCLCKVDRGIGPVLEGRKNGKLCVSHLDIESSNHSERKHSKKACYKDNNIYEKLIDDSYGILICEGENTPDTNTVERKNHQAVGNVSSNDFELNKYENCHILGLATVREMNRASGISSMKLRILCAKCLQNHDPLLTNCVEPVKILQDEHCPEVLNNCDMHIDLNQAMMRQNSVAVCPYPYIVAESESTDYPSDTEVTANNNQAEDDVQSLSTYFSSVTCNPQRSNYRQYYKPQHIESQKPTKLSQFIWAAATMMPKHSDEQAIYNQSSNDQIDPQKEFTGLEYVRTWLLASHPRALASESSLNASVSQQQHLRSTGLGYKRNDEEIPDIGMVSTGILQSGRRSAPTVSKYNDAQLKTKYTCDKTITKKKRYRQIQKRQRPIGCGASPPPNDLDKGVSNGNSNTVDDVSSIRGTFVNTTTKVNKTATKAPHDETSGDCTANSRFQPPPSRKQHPLLVYDMIPREEQEKPLTVTTHKKCRDQLDLLHKELETVV